MSDISMFHTIDLLKDGDGPDVLVEITCHDILHPGYGSSVVQWMPRRNYDYVLRTLMAGTN